MSDLDNDKKLFIQKYLGEGLSESETDQLKEYSQNIDFNKELLFQANVLDALSENRRTSVRHALADAKEEMESELKTKGALKKGLVLIVLSLLLALTLFLFYSNKSSEDIASTMFAAYYQPYPPEVLLRGEKNQSDDLISSAMQAYVISDYKRTLELFDKVEDPSERIQLYKAIALLELNDLDASIVILNKLKSSYTRSIKEKAEWYYLMALLKGGNMSSAESTLLTLLARKDHLYYDKLNELSENIN